MRTFLAAGVVALQVAVLAFIAVQREWVVRFGQPILLRTAPIDPNDPMRGYYARLNYDISDVPQSYWRGGLKARAAGNAYDQGRWRDLGVYAALQLDEAGVAQLVSLSDERPANGLYLRGRVNHCDGARLNIRYGVEALFMEQGKSQKLEDARRAERVGAPLDAEVVVNAAGLAVLKGYHWEPLGIIATFERAPIVPPAPVAGAPRPPARQAITAIKVELKNYGPQTVAVVDLPGAASFRLVAEPRGAEPRYQWAGRDRTVPPAADNLIVLKPGESRTTRIDLTAEEWFVIDTKAPAANQKPIALRDITDLWSATFRVEYAAPAKASLVGLPHAERVWHGRLRSRAFNPSAGID